MDSAESLPARSGLSPAPSRRALLPGPLTLLAALLVGLITIALAAVDRPRAWQLMLIAISAFAYLVSGRAFEKSLLLTIVVACLLPSESFRRVIKPEEAMPLVAGLLFLMNRSSSEYRALRGNWTERWILLLIGAALISAILGLAAGHPWPNILDEFALYLEFTLAIVVIRSGLSDRWIKRLFQALLACAVVISLVYLERFVASGGKRAVSDQQHILNVAVPVLFAFLFLARDLKERLITAIIVLPMIPAVYVTQTRSLWLYIPFSIILLATVLAAHRHIRMRDVYVMGAVAGSIVLVILGYTWLTSGVGAGHQAIADRAGSLRHLSTDLSLACRIDLGFQAYSRFARHPFFGTGLGDFLRYRILQTGEHMYFTDFSYMWVLWKLGVIGLVPLLGLYFVFLGRTWSVYRQTSDHFQRCVAAGTFAAFAALLVIGFESGILVIYRFNLVWAILMGVFEHWAQQIRLRQVPVAPP